MTGHGRTRSRVDRDSFDDRVSMKRKWHRRRFAIANFRLVTELHRTMLCASVYRATKQPGTIAGLLLPEVMAYCRTCCIPSPHASTSPLTTLERITRKSAILPSRSSSSIKTTRSRLRLKVSKRRTDYGKRITPHVHFSYLTWRHPRPLNIIYRSLRLISGIRVSICHPFLRYLRPHIVVH